MVTDNRLEGLQAAQVNASAAESEAFEGVPQWYEIPSELSEIIEKGVLQRERMFWLRATHILKDVVNSALLRRAIYAELRCWEMENRAAEMALIANGAADRVKELEAKMNELAEATSG